ncbi:MAG: hypothetical protein J6N15_03375 [Ruminiclostridium sp.]|nr:hypothetical protein [Ruminiclostridium sp.]
MKRTVICASLIAAMAVTGTVLWQHTERTAADTAAGLRTLGTLPMSEREEFAEEIYARWGDFCEKNIFLTNNECAFEISMSLADIIGDLRSGEDDISAECEEAALLAELYARSTRPCFHNVF